MLATTQPASLVAAISFILFPLALTAELAGLITGIVRTHPRLRPVR